MIRKRLITLAVSCLCGAVLLTGCSFSETLDKILGHTESEVESGSKDKVKKNVKDVDTSLEKPNFDTNLEGSVQIPAGSEGSVLTVEASVTDGGTVTYQWYRNNVNSNGGGELLEGQTGNTYTPDVSELGTMYYYVVATNDHGDKVNKSTSGVVEVQIVPEGNWVDDNGARKYQLYDGSFVAGAWRDIEGQRYAFDENGNMRTGWFQDGDGSWYYLNPDGTMARDMEVDGFAVDSEGRSEAKKQAVADEAAQQAPQEPQAPADQPAQ